MYLPISCALYAVFSISDGIIYAARSNNRIQPAVLSPFKPFSGISGHLYAFILLALFLGLLVAGGYVFCSLPFPFFQQKALQQPSVIFCNFMYIHFNFHFFAQIAL